MSTPDVHARLDDLSLRLRRLERELDELRAMTAAPAPRPAPKPEPLPAAPMWPPPRPAAPRPARRPRPSVPQIDASRALAWSGGVVTILGVVFFFVLAVDRGWIGPVARVSLGAVASALVFAAGLALHRRYGDSYSASTAVAAGIAGGFATLLFAAARYDLLPDVAALAGAGLLAAVATATALAWGDQTVAGLGLVGAMLVPLAAAIDEPNHLTVTGTWFAALTLAATAVVALRRRWLPMLAVAAPVAIVQVLVLARQAEGAGPASVAAATWLLLLAIAVVEQRRNPRTLDRLPAGLVTAGTVMAGLSAAQLFDGRAEGYALLAIAAVELAAGVLLYGARRLPELGALLGVAGLTVGAVAAADLLSGATLASAWAAEAAVLAWLAPRLRDARLILVSTAFLAAAMAHALVVDAPLRQFFVAGPDPASGAVALVAVAAAAVVAAVYAGPWTAELPRAEGVLGFLREPTELAAATWRERRIGALWLAPALLLYAASLGLLDAFDSFAWAHVAVRGLIAVTAVGLLACAGSGWRRHLAWGGHVLLAALLWLMVATGLFSTAPQWGWATGITAGAMLVALLLDELRFLDPALAWAPPALAPLSLGFAVAATELLVNGPDASNVALLGVAALYTALACIVPRRDTSTALWAPALIVSLYAATQLLDGTILVLAISAAAAAIVTLGEIVGERRLQLASAGLLLAALGHVLAVDAPAHEFFVANANPASGTIAIAALVAAGAVFALTRFPGEHPRWRQIAGGATALLALYGLSLAILGGFEWLGVASVATSFQRGHTAVSAVWGLLGLLALAAGLRRRSPGLRAAGFALLGISLAKLFLYDLAALSSVTRALSFLAVGAVLLVGGFLYQRLAREDGNGGGPLPAH